MSVSWFWGPGVYLWRDCSRQHCLLKTGPERFCALVPFKNPDNVIDVSIIYTSLEGFGTLQRVFAIHTSLCAVSPPGRTADAQDWRRGDEDSVSSPAARRLLFVWPFADRYNSFCWCSELAKSCTVSQQCWLTNAQQLISDGCSASS